MQKQTHPALETWRNQIDAIDEQVLQLIAKRRQIVLEIGEYKRAHGLPPLDAERWEQVLQSKMFLAQKLDVSPAFIRDLYNLIHEYSLELEQ